MTNVTNDAEHRTPHTARLLTTQSSLKQTSTFMGFECIQTIRADVGRPYDTYQKVVFIEMRQNISDLT